MRNALRVTTPLKQAVSVLPTDTAKRVAIMTAQVPTKPAETVLAVLLDHILPQIMSAQELGHFSCQIEKAMSVDNSVVDAEEETDPIKLLQIITERIKEGN